VAGAALVLTSGCGVVSKVKGEAEPAKQPFTISFAGDVHFAGDLENRLASRPDTFFGPVGDILKGSDLAMVNLETAITTGGTPAPKQFTFRAPATAFRALKGAGIDVVTMANNHGEDYGETGLRDSLAASKQAGFPVVGIGNNAAEAYKPWTTTVKNTKVAIIGATQVLDDNLVEAWTATDTKPGLASAKNAPRLVKAVQDAHKTADVVIVDLHWGMELNSCPTQVQKQLAGQLTAAGADAVIGSHAHVLLAGGFKDGKYVHYGLGNFVFYNANGRTAQSGVLTLTFDARDKTRKVTKSVWRPATLVDGVAQPLQGAEEQQQRAQWEGLRNCADVKAA
jgi:poly-gamma-glutamate synthesis protein (capsule biosynthesis protein)